MGVTSTKSGRLEINLSLSEKRDGKSHLGTILLSAVSKIWRFCMVIRSVLSGVGGSTGGWRCCWDAPGLPHLPPATLKNPPPYISLLFLCFCSDGSNHHKIWTAGGKSVFYLGSGLGKAIWKQFYFTTIAHWSPALRSWALTLKELRNLLPSFMYIL